VALRIPYTWISRYRSVCTKDYDSIGFQAKGRARTWIMDKAEHAELSTRHTELYLGLDAWGKPGYQLGYTDSYSDISTHTVLYDMVYQGIMIFRYRI
jgi:hypothetical protein